MQASEAPRKSAKGKGVDPEAARRNREGRAVQLRKEKRFDRANIERRKVRMNKTQAIVGTSLFFNIMNDFSLKQMTPQTQLLKARPHREAMQCYPKSVPS